MKLDNQLLTVSYDPEQLQALKLGIELQLTTATTVLEDPNFQMGEEGLKDLVRQRELLSDLLDDLNEGIQKLQEKIDAREYMQSLLEEELTDLEGNATQHADQNPMGCTPSCEICKVRDESIRTVRNALELYS